MYNYISDGDNMKNIAIFQTDLNIGGIEKSLINLLNNIDYTKYNIDLYLFNKNNLFINDIPKQVNVIYLKSKRYNRFIYFNILNKLYKNKIIKEYDVSIDYNSYSMDTALACLNCKSKKKVIYVHNDIKIKLHEEYKYRILYHFFKEKYKYFDEIVGVSKSVIDTFKEVTGLKDKKYFVIPNIINTKEIFDKKDDYIEFSIDENKYNLCTSGRLVHQKGFDLLLLYISELTKYRKDFHLYMIGDGPLREDLIKMINKLNINSYVTLCGYKKNPYAIMNKMDGFILTSRYEGQGMVFLEAKALGLDIVMPKHLEKYIDDIKGTNDIVDALNKLKKHSKKLNSLDKYNNKSIKEFYKL